MTITPIPAAGIQGETRLKEAAATEFQTIIELVRNALQKTLYPNDPNRWVGMVALYPDRVVVAGGDGRLHAYPYTLTDQNQVELGTAQEVILDHKPVAAMREAQGIFLEAQDDKGLKWRIRVIQAGLSGNRYYYPDSVLREATPLFNGARVFVKGDEEHLAGKGKDFRNLIGRLSNAKFVEGKKTDTGEIQADLELLASAGDVPAKMLEAWNRDMAQDLFGFSIDASGKVKSETGRNVAQKITKVNSVDLIIEPGAGGQLINLIEARDPNLEAEDMKLRDRMVEAVKRANNGTLPDGLDINDDAALETAYREALKPAPAPKTEPKGDDKPVTRAELEAIEARAHLREALAGSNLPEPTKDRIRGMFADETGWGAKEVDAAIKSEREYLGRMTEAGKVTGLGDIDIAPGKDRSEKIATMLDAFFDPAHKDHGSVRSFKECYIQITGDRRVTGAWENVDKARLREAMGEAMRESLDTSGLTNVLSAAIRRAMLREYVAAVEYDGWRRIASVVPVADFRTNERVRFGGYGDLPTVNQGAAYAALTSPTDEKATYAVAKKGGTEDMTLEAIKNDDVGLIQRIPVKLGRAAKRTLAKFVFDFIRTNPTIYDNTALFTAGHGNLGSAALDATSLDARRLAMLKQSELSSADRLGIGPKSLLVPLDLQKTAVDLFKLSTNNEKNFIQSLVLDIIPVWYWTDANDWALAADPRDIPGLEIGFLDGNEEPELFVQDNPTVGSMFTNDKLTWKIRHIYGGDITDYRAFDKSVVA